MKLRNQELERRKKAFDGYDNRMKNKANADLTNQGKGKSKKMVASVVDVGNITYENFCGMTIRRFKGS